MNGSICFRALWHGLRQWQRGEQSEQLRAQLLDSSWFPSSQANILDLLVRKEHQSCPQLRVEDEDDSATLFTNALLKQDRFTLGLSSNIPARFLNKNMLPYQIWVGSHLFELVPAEDGSLRLEGGPIHVGRESRLLEVKVFQAGDFVYREQVQLWQQEDDITIFHGRTGKRVRDVRTFVAEAGAPYTILAPSDVVMLPRATRIESANNFWLFHVYSEGLPEGLAATVEHFPIWALARIADTKSFENTGKLELRAESMTLNRLRAFPFRGVGVRSFRVAGKTLAGSEALMTLSPAKRWNGKVVPAILDDGQKIELEMCTEEESTGAAYLDETGTWVSMDALATVDSAALEGRELVISWAGRWKGHLAQDRAPQSHEDCWLMLGDQPLRSQPDFVRSQQIRAMGESLSLRFGLMYERRPGVTLSPSTMYCGQLHSIQKDGAWFRLQLREPSMRASEYRVHVWERGAAVPRALDPTEIEYDAQGSVLSIMFDSAPAPLGWALSLGRLWKGSRFHADPNTGGAAWDAVCAGWLEIFGRQGKREGAWEALAVCLRWWKFPVLMHPFLDAIESRVQAEPSATFRAWVRKKEGENILCPGVDNDYLVPFRTLLWGFQPNAALCSSLLAGLWRRDSETFANGYGVLFPELRFLLNSHPILLARIVCSTIAELGREELRKVTTMPSESSLSLVKDGQRKAHIEQQSRALLHLFVRCVSETVGVTPDGQSPLPRLEAKALEDLKSWTDRTNLDSIYFNRHIISPAESTFHGARSEDKQLKIAIARSPATRAFLTCHLVEGFGKGEVL